MGDHGFNFSQPPRRERKTFEPPPWERDQYEDLARKQGGEAPLETEVLHAQPPITGDETAVNACGRAAENEPLGGEPGVLKEGTAAQQATTQGEGKKSNSLNERKVAAMLIDLQVEEPPALREVWKVAMVAAMVVGVIGAVLVMWGVAALVMAPKTGQIGLIGGLVLLFFGAGFIGGGVWLAERTLRQRGVL